MSRIFSSAELSPQLTWWTAIRARTSGPTRDAHETQHAISDQIPMGLCRRRQLHKMRGGQQQGLVFDTSGRTQLKMFSQTGRVAGVFSTPLTTP